MNEELMPIRLAIFASGQGTNAREIIRYFHEAGNLILNRRVQICLIICNRTGAGILDIAKTAGIPVLLIEKEKFFRGSHYLEEFADRNISFVVLAGFLWKIPPELIRAYPDRILNIHPALLPAYGGKGMYGKAVHEAIIAANEHQSGITIHYVDELYDHGRIFFQAGVNLSPEETAETLAEKIHILEHRHYPQQIARWLEKSLKDGG
jgi:phosphoribosylglycinamide formyltransferase-1